MLYLLFSGDFFGQYMCDCFSVYDDENHVFQTSDCFSISIHEDLHIPFGVFKSDESLWM